MHVAAVAGMARNTFLSLAALTSLSVAASLLPSSPAHACSPMPGPAGWSVAEPSFIANGLPTDAPIPLGLTFDARGPAGAASRGTLQVQVTDDLGTPIDGSVLASAGDRVYFFRPAAPLAASTHYQVSTTIDGGTIASGAPTRSFGFETTAGPMTPLAVPADLAANVSLAWESFGGDFVCCDGATPNDIDTCGAVRTGHCFATAGEPRLRFMLSWSPFPAAEQEFLSVRVVDASGETDAYIFGDGRTSIGVEFKNQAAQYCAALEVTNTARATPETVRSAPICVTHGTLPPLASYEPDFSEELRKCSTAPAGYEDAWARATGSGPGTQGTNTTGASADEQPASSDSGGCSLATRGSLGEVGGVAALVAMVASAALRRRRRSG